MVTPRLLVAGLLTLGLASAAAALAQRMSAGAAPPARLEHRGFDFTSWSADEYMSAGAEASLRRLAATGANAVALNPTWYQDSRRSTRIEPTPAGPRRTRPWRSPWHGPGRLASRCSCGRWSTPATAPRARP